MNPRLSLIVGARPNFMKIAPVLRALETRAHVELVHTGQHYDFSMSETFFSDLGLPRPDANLGVGSGSHVEQTARVMLAFEQYIEDTRPDGVVVVGDVNSTLAVSLVASKLGIPIGHVEAGLRSRDWSMPEEINRVLTDRLSRWLFTPSEDANENLLAENIEPERIRLVGNVMIDTLLRELPRARQRVPDLIDRLDLPSRFAIVTLHRPSNVDNHRLLHDLLAVIGEIGSRVPILFPVHPRTRAALEDVGIPDTIRCIDPLGYLDFLALMSASMLVMSDSGGIQEETSVLGVPCLTLRENTERPITVSIGTNKVVGVDPKVIREAAEHALSRDWVPAEIPLWDGHAGLRIAEALLEDLT